MKLKFPLLFIFLLFSTPATHAQWKKITHIFQNYILHDTIVDVSKKSHYIPISAIQSYRDKMWQIWKKSYTTFTSTPLILDNQEVHAWILPEALEPQATLNYRFFTTHNRSPYQLQGGRYATFSAQKQPFFLYLHGSGPKQKEFETGWELAKHFHVGNSFYFIPQIPNEGPWYRWYQKSKQWMIEHLLRAVLSRDDIDPNRLYLMGISEGGYGSQRLASFYADYWAAIGAMAGGEPLKNAPAENLRNTPFSLRTGEKDYGFYRNFLTLHTASALDSLSQLHIGSYRHWINLEQGKGHGINYALTPTWLLQWQRNPHPTQITWEDFEMDGRHRKGFANMEVLHRPSSLRTRYDMEIHQNTIRINIHEVEYHTTLKDPHWGIDLLFQRSYTLAQHGKIRLYLDENMIDYAQPINIICNGKRMKKIHVRPHLQAMMRSIMLFGDPTRVYSTYIDIDY